MLPLWQVSPADQQAALARSNGRALRARKGNRRCGLASGDTLHVRSPVVLVAPSAFTARLANERWPFCRHVSPIQ